jgi:hypothetical protein
MYLFRFADSVQPGTNVTHSTIDTSTREQDYLCGQQPVLCDDIGR